MTNVNELCKAAAFVLTTFDGTAGVGLLCVDCRYASVLWPGDDRIDRRFGTPADWAAVGRELKAGLPTTTLSPLTACAYVLSGDTGARVQWVGWAKCVEVDDPSKTPAILDAMLSEACELLRTVPKAKKLQSRLTCPACGVVVVDTMPVNYCQRFYDCRTCGAVITTEPGLCCVYCSHGDTPCPPKQTGWCCEAPNG